MYKAKVLIAKVSMLSLFFSVSALAQTLPAGEGQELVQQKCASCHALSLVTAEKATPERWGAVLKQMKTNGLKVTEAEEATILKYLSQHFGPGDAAEAPAASGVTGQAPVKGQPVQDSYVQHQSANKTAVLTVIAGETDANAGLNFNGGFKGNKGFTVPVGYKVQLKFSNVAAMPHSILVIKDAKTLPAQYTAAMAAFPRAVSQKLAVGVAKGTPVETLTFTVNKAGRYLLVCGVPGHALGGQYIYLEVSDKVKEPRFQ